jgi:peptide/nickel transport system permease protein
MLAYIIRRFAQSLVVVMLLLLITFILLHLLPGGPVRAILGPRASRLETRTFIHQNGFDKPLVVQYFDYLNRIILHGDLGYSFKANQSVDAILGEDLPKSIELVGASTIISLVIGIVTGMFQAIRRNRFDDHALTGTAFVLYAMPDFFLALVLIDIFAIRLHVVPTQAPQGTGWGAAFSDPKGMILPVATLSLTSIAIFSRYMRSSALDVFGQDFIRTARAKGASSSRIVWRHTMRNACIPIITLVGLSLPGLFGGAIITEEVFNYPGIGLATFNAALNKDYALLLGTTVIFGFTTIFGNLIADLLYAFVDPRVRVT